jgi:hypothetical protein
MTNDHVRSYTGDSIQSFIDEEAETTTDEIGVIFMQIQTEKGILESATGTATGVGGFILAGSAGLGASGALLNPYVGGAAIAATAASGGIAALQTWQNRQVSLGYCGELTDTQEEGLKGCSIVTTFDYHNIEKLNKFCGRVEGTP